MLSVTSILYKWLGVTGNRYVSNTTDGLRMNWLHGLAGRTTSELVRLYLPHPLPGATLDSQDIADDLGGLILHKNICFIEVQVSSSSWNN